MIGILRCVDGQLIVRGDALGKVFVVPEAYSRPALNVGAGPFSGVDRSLLFERAFRREHTFRAPPRQGEWDGEALAFLYLEVAPTLGQLPPEILSRRMQEVEAEWLRLGRLLDDLRALEKQ